MKYIVYFKDEDGIPTTHRTYDSKTIAMKEAYWMIQSSMDEETGDFTNYWVEEVDLA